MTNLPTPDPTDFQDGKVECVSLGCQEDQQQMCQQTEKRLPEAPQRGGEAPEGNQPPEHRRWGSRVPEWHLIIPPCCWWWTLKSTFLLWFLLEPKAFCADFLSIKTLCIQVSGPSPLPRTGPSVWPWSTEESSPSTTWSRRGKRTASKRSLPQISRKWLCTSPEAFRYVVRSMFCAVVNVSNLVDIRVQQPGIRKLVSIGKSNIMACTLLYQMQLQ